jgi:hypothetical protein
MRPQMRALGAIRMRRMRRRRRLGLRVVHVEISEDAAEAEKRPVD